MKKTSVAVGQGITLSSRLQRVLELVVQAEADEIRQFLGSTYNKLNKPWGLHSRLIAALRERLNEIEASFVDPADSSERKAKFRERETEGWYLLQAVRRANLIEKYISSRPWEAVSLAYELGELVTELAFKLDFEKAALAGQKTLEAQKAAAGARRRQPRAVRVAFVNSLVDQGHLVTKAFKIAGVHFGVKFQTIRNDWYRK